MKDRVMPDTLMLFARMNLHPPQSNWPHLPDPIDSRHRAPRPSLRQRLREMWK
ncbi:hypothetical protein [Thioclava sp. F28-4]|uniref:hypothetical protein n=1 Tax=Thioclava sp. F28-4 TaxID=1915315 RepID=UPI00143B7113|nr:hypothetical protein [Thioclava sp. F28-4]